MPSGCDVSAFQGPIEPEWFDQWDFVIVRAFDRHGNLDARFLANWRAAEGRTLRGAYGWPKPEADNRHLGAQLVTVAADAELGVWADWEPSQEYGLASLEELAAYLEGCGDRLKGVYAGLFVYPSDAPDWLGRVPWWVPNYGPNDGERHAVEPASRVYRDWQIHQFSSRGSGPNGGALDLNYAPTLAWAMGGTVRDPIYPAAVWRPGVNAGYRAGRTAVTSVVCHYTVGVDSAPIGDRGYFNFLVRRDGEVVQFAEVDAVCWHAGSPWNGLGPGVEVEYHPSYDGDEIFTSAAYAATARLVEWLHDEWGVPFDFYDGSRIAAWQGFITHRSLIQTGDLHSDWWPVLPRVMVPEPEDDDEMKPGVFVTADGVPGVWYVYAGTKQWCKTKDVVDAIAYLGWSRNGWDDPGKIAAATLLRFATIGDEPDGMPNG